MSFILLSSFLLCSYRITHHDLLNFSPCGLTNQNTKFSFIMFYYNIFVDNEDDEDDEENESGENDQEEEDIEKDRDLEEEDAEHNPYGYNSHYDHNGPTVNELLHKVKDYLVIERNLHNLEMTCTCETKDDMKDKNVHYWDNSAKSYYPVKKALRIRRPQLKCRCHAAPFFWYNFYFNILLYIFFTCLHQNSTKYC